MGQIIGSAAKPKRCNLNKLSQLETPAAGEHILVSSDNSMNAAGQGNFDCYIVGDGVTAASELELKPIYDIESVLDGIIELVQPTFIEGYSLNSTGRQVANSLWMISDYLHVEQVSAGDVFVWKGIATNASACICFYTSDNTFLQAFSATGASRTITIAESAKAIGATKIRASFLVQGQAYLSQNGTDVLRKNSYYKLTGFDDLKKSVESMTPVFNLMQYDIYNEDAATSSVITEKSAYKGNYSSVAYSGVTRGVYFIDTDIYKDFTLEVTPLSSNLKVAIHGWKDKEMSSKIYDSGWLTVNQVFTANAETIKGARYIVFFVTYSSTGIPTFSEFTENISWSLTYSSIGILTKIHNLNEQIGGPSSGFDYDGDKIRLKKYRYSAKEIGTLQNGSSTRQGGALYGNYLFQFHDTLETICVFDLQNASNVDKLTLTAMENCHAGSGGFSSTFYDASDPFPLLYISSMDEKKIYVYRITGTVGALAISLIQTITLDTEYYLPNIAIDVENNKIVIFGYTQNSWDSPTNNNSVVFTCDIPSYSADVTVSSFSDAFVLPFIYAEQGAFASEGLLFLSYGNTRSTYGGGIYVIDYINQNVRNHINLLSVGQLEPEACGKWNDEYIIFTTINGLVYQLIF